MSKINDVIKKFINDLENKIMKLENEYNRLKQDEDDYYLSENLLEILLESKEAFVEGLLSRNDRQQDIIDKFLNKIINPNDVDRLYDEARNMYYLKKFGISDKKEIKYQKSQIEDVLNHIEEAIQEYLDSSSVDDILRKEEEISNTINRYIELGSAFNEDSLESDIKDIDFFSKTIEESILTNEEKELLLLYTLDKTSKMYEHTLKSRNKNNQDNITEEINNILRNEETREKIFTKIRQVNKKDISEDELLAVAREELTIRMLLKSLSIEDALIDFYNTYSIEDLDNSDVSLMFVEPINEEKNNKKR